MNGNIIGLRKQGFQGNAFKAGFFNEIPGDKGIVDNDLHFKSPGPVGNDRSDFSESDDAENFVKDFPSLKILFFPFTCFYRSRALGNVTGQGQHHGDGVFGCCYHVATRRVHYDDPLFGGSRNIDIVQSDAGAAHNL